MTDEQIRIAIAKSCGWSEIDRYIGQEKMPEGLLKGQNPKYKGGKKEELPDYLNSLDAMHCAEDELLLKHPDLRQSYRRILIDCCGTENLYWRATARQRAIAFIKTLNLPCKS